MRNRSRVLDLLARLLLVVLAVLFSLALLELVARLLGPPYGTTDSIYECDRLLGWRGKPNVSRIVTTDGYSHMTFWNSHGMHDGEFTVAKPEDTFRVLMMGDSFVEALQVDEGATSQHVLENILASVAPANTRIEVIAASSGGWGPTQELMFFRNEGKAYAVDLVLVMWVPENDLLDILPDERLTHGGVNCYAPYFAVCDGQFDPGPWFSTPGVQPTWQHCSPLKKKLVSGLNRLYFSSRLYQRLEPLLGQLHHKIEYANPYAPWLLGDHVFPVLNYSYQLTAGIYGRLAEEAAQAGAQTAFVIVPSKQALYVESEPGYLENLLENGVEIGGGEIDVTLPNQVFETLMAQKGLAVLDLYPEFLSRMPDAGEPLYWETDTHWTVAGNRLAAQLIADWLVENGLVPSNRQAE